jgi:hypothetical protein
MKLEEIHSTWTLDAKINPLDLSGESLNTPKLHGKYLKILSEERLKLKKLRSSKDELTLAKTEYFMGKMAREDMQARGWEPFTMRLLKQDVPTYMNADQDVIRLNLQIGLQEEKVEVLESIMKTIANRGFQIKNYIDWKKFENGLG